MVTPVLGPTLFVSWPDGEPPFEPGVPYWCEAVTGIPPDEERPSGTASIRFLTFVPVPREDLERLISGYLGHTHGPDDDEFLRWWHQGFDEAWHQQETRVAGLEADLSAIYGRMRHTHPDQVTCAAAGPQGHPPHIGGGR